VLRREFGANGLTLTALCSGRRLEARGPGCVSLVRTAMPSSRIARILCRCASIAARARLRRARQAATATRATEKEPAISSWGLRNQHVYTTRITAAAVIAV